MSDLVKRLRENCNGNPAKVIWPHRVLHDAADRIEELTAERDRLRDILRQIKWKSAHKDNMEFSALISYCQMDAILAALKTEGDG